MKKKSLTLTLLAVIAAFLVTSCSSSVSLTSWKDPNENAQISKVVIIPLFDKLEYMKPFEQTMVAYFSSQGLKSMGSLDFLNPNIKYPLDQVQKKIDSLGADGVLVFKYKGTDQSQSYVPPTYYGGGWGGYWGGGYWGGGFYGGGVATGGYWTTTSTVNLTASLYTKKGGTAEWTAEISVTDPNYVDQAANTIAQNIYEDWVKYNILKSVVKTK
ncbi:MAG: hypothetical protein M0Q38_13310 [Bacteroidales bacterium]|jgi:hypothetical protein|nr:hypothetical protein [Bacteroidales bacterium]